MSAVIDRPVLLEPDDEHGGAGSGATGPGSSTGRSDHQATVPGSTAGPRWAAAGPGWLLAGALSAGAGVIHLAMVPSHMAEWAPEGWAFVVSGWLQIVVAAFLVQRSRPRLAQFMVVADVALVAAWVITRTSGSPWGPEQGLAHAAAFVDVTCVVMEAAFVLLALGLAGRTESGRRVRRGVNAAAVAGAVGVLALSSSAVASPSARNHAHGGAGSEAVGHPHAATDTGTGATSTDGHDHGTAAPTVDDKGLSLLGNGHQHEQVLVALDPATEAALAPQIASTEQWIARYPTARDAIADGFQLTGPYMPGIGAHYGQLSSLLRPGGGLGVLGADGKVTEAGLDTAPFLIYDGPGADAELAGFMYLSSRMPSQGQPDGFVGPNDVWHTHQNICVGYHDGKAQAPYGVDSSVTKEQCDRYPGSVLIPDTPYMIHVWSVPGHESPEGIFSDVTSALTCPDGTYYQISMDDLGYRPSTCLSAQ
jgi:hypothetical protein